MSKLATARLFDGAPTGGERFARDNEPQYAYLAQSCRVEAARVRAFMELLLDKVPPSKRSELIHAFRREDDRHHYGAALEMVAAGLFDKLGATLAHGSYQGGARTPDFEASWTDGRVYVECTTVTEIRDGEQDGERHRATIAGALRNVQNREFYIDVRDWAGFPRAVPVDLPQMADELRDWLETKRRVDVVGRLDPTSSPWAVRERAPKRAFERDGYGFTAYAIPKADGSVGSTERVPFASPDDPIVAFEAVHSHEKLRDDLSQKAWRYINAPLPLVLVATTHRWRLYEPDLRAALFGSLTLRIQGNDVVEQFHAPNGLWTRGSKPRFSHVAGVVFINRAEPWRLGQADLVVYANPWSSAPLPAAFDGLRSVRVDADGAFVETLGAARLRDVFGLPVGWPEELAAALS